jgi:rare lipoprotein A
MTPKRIRCIAGVALTSLLLCWLEIVPAMAQIPTGEVIRPAMETAAPEEGVPEGKIGYAVYYARRYHGKRTSSGHRHDREAMVAAHPTLPLGTKVKVIHLANHRSAVVTINDRCPKRPFEFIDLSRAAAWKLGFLGKGKARVRMIPLAPPPG